MSKLNINGNEWLELVFEGKNKEYGAYKIRQEEGKTTMKAFLVSLLLLGTMVGLILGLSSFEKKPNIIKCNFDERVTPIDLSKRQKPEVVKPKIVETKKGTPLKQPESTDLINPVVVDSNKPTDNITENNNLGLTTDENATKGGAGDGLETGTDHPIIVLPIDKPFDPEAIVTSVDKNPNFPGGINLFLKEVGKKFVAPELDEEKTLKVIVFFVVERDGSLSNIKVANDPGFGMGAEAIRVLKAIKTKWEPGMYKGQKVRTTFSLPITVNIKGAE